MSEEERRGPWPVAGIEWLPLLASSGNHRVFPRSSVSLSRGVSQVCQRMSVEVRACSLYECLFIRGAGWVSQRSAGRFLETQRVHTTTFCNAINFWDGGWGWAVLGLLII